MPERWYAIQVVGGREVSTCRMIQKCLDIEQKQTGGRSASEVFVPHYMKAVRKQGVVETTTELLLPGYVIAVSRDAEALSLRMRRIPALTRVLGNGTEFIPLSRQEADWINRYAEGPDRTVELSEGLIHPGDVIEVVKGPLKGQEAKITHVAQRKCEAYLEMEFAGRTVEVKVGLSLVRAKRD